MILLNILSALLLTVVAVAILSNREFGLILQASAIVATVGYLYLPSTLLLMILGGRLFPSIADSYAGDEGRTVAIVDAFLLAALAVVAFALWI